MLQHGNRTDRADRATDSGGGNRGNTSSRKAGTVFPVPATIEIRTGRVVSTRFFHGGGRG